MKRTKSLIALLAILLGVFWMNSCGSSTPEIIKVNPEFSEYISGYTSGMVYRQDAIRIELAEGVQDLEKMSQKKLNDLLEIEPAIEGNVVAISERQIEFVPAEPLPTNQFYTVHFDLDKLAEVKKGFEDFVFQFSTFEQTLELDIYGLRNYNSYQIEYQQLEGSITTRDYEDTAMLRKTLTFDLDGKSLPFSLRTNSYNDDVYFKVDSIQRLKKEQTILVKWNGKPINSFSKGSKEITVSGLGDFSVSKASVIEEEDQKVELTFTEPLQQGQNLDGLITIQDIDELSYKINHNVVTVFLPNRFVGEKKLKVSAGVKNVAGYKMNKGYEESLIFHEPYPLVRIKGSGSILPNSQGLIFPFEAIALNAVDVRVIRIFEKNVHHFLQVNELDGEDELTRFGEVVAEKKIDLTTDKRKNLKQWNTHVLDLQKLIKTQPGAIYQVAVKFERDYAICDCGEEDEEEEESEEITGESGYEEFVVEDRGYWNDWNSNEQNWHTYGFDGYSTWSYRSDEDDTPCESDYYYGKAVQRNILASNIGMIFKLDEDKTANVFLSNMVTTAPMANVQVSFYDYNRKLIASETSNGQGMLKVKLRNKPFLMIAKKGTQRGYMKLNDGHVNSLSKFDVDGELVQKGIKGFLYAERGVWRPGDSLYINFMLQDKYDKFPKNHPVNFEFVDPNGNVVYEVSKVKNVNGVYDFRTATSADARTGNYRANVRVGNKTYTKRFKIETIKPNRLKVKLDVNLGNNADSCLLTAKWLHGATAKDLKANVQMYLTPMHTSFKGFKNYIFDSPVRSGGSASKTVFSGNLDKIGQALFASKTAGVSDASGMLQARYITKVFEKGGDFSIDRKVSSFSPYSTYVGMRIPKTSVYDNTLETDKTHRFDLVSVNQKGKLVSNTKLEVRVYKLSWNWWYDGDEDFATFTSRNGAILVRDTVIKTTKGKGAFMFDATSADYGKYLITVTDKEGGHQTGEVIHIDWPYWSRAHRTENEFATMLTFATDKSKYVKGENIKLSFPSPSAGRALVSVETSERVIKKFWIETKKGETTHEFMATADMSPNVFLHVTLIQPHNATKNDLPIRMYGVMPIEVDDPNTHLHPVISMRSKIRPESKTNITVREEHGKKMTYTLAIVDDGLLDLTHFQTPEPWNTFYAREALGVKTWDMYNDVIGAYTGKLDHLLSIGGDGSAIVGNGPKANRFKPMVTFLGPFELPAGGSRRHTVDIPNYVGSVRVMVVARDEEAYGKTQKTVIVKKPLMVLATVPRVLGPGEEFALPVDVFAMERHVKNVKVRIETNGMFELVDSKSKSIQFSAEGDEIVNFMLRTKQKVGVGKVKIIAQSGSEVAMQEIEVDIRPSNPVSYDAKDFVLDPGQSISTSLSMDGLLGTNRGIIEVSTTPAINLEKRLGYLISYPHGCVEQTTSAAFPQLYLSSLSTMKESEKREVSKNIKAAIKRLQLFQTSEGGFSYWPGESDESEWGTNYAGHFILEAELMGYRLPAKMKSSWVHYQGAKARNWSGYGSAQSRSSKSDQLTQAYRLYLLALSNNAEIGAMNRMRESRDLSTAAKWRLASAYAMIGQKEVANRLVNDLDDKVADYTELSNSFGSALRDKAIILEAQGILGNKTEGYESLKYLAEVLRSKRWMSTQETAYCLLSVAKFCKVDASSASSKLAYILNGEAKRNLTVGGKIKKVILAERAGQKQRTASLENMGSTTLFVTVITEKIPVQGKERKKFSKMMMDVRYTDMDGRKIDVQKLKQGTEFIAEVRLTNTSKRTKYKEMALNQIFPSGWEIHNSRLFGSTGYTSSARYQDIRDDRVLSYYSLAPGESKTIKITLNATYLGKFYLPAVYSEAMYDHTIQAQIPGRWVEVISEDAVTNKPS